MFAPQYFALATKTTVFLAALTVCLAARRFAPQQPALLKLKHCFARCLSNGEAVSATTEISPFFPSEKSHSGIDVKAIAFTAWVR